MAARGVSYEYVLEAAAPPGDAYVPITECYVPVEGWAWEIAREGGAPEPDVQAGLIFRTQLGSLCLVAVGDVRLRVSRTELDARDAPLGAPTLASESALPVHVCTTTCERPEMSVAGIRLLRVRDAQRPSPSAACMRPALAAACVRLLGASTARGAPPNAPTTALENESPTHARTAAGECSTITDARAAAPLPENGEPCHLPPELWAIVFTHVSRDYHVETRAAFTAACRAYAYAAGTFRPPVPGVYLESRGPDGSLRRGRQLSAESVARQKGRLQPLGFIAWPADAGAVGQMVEYWVVDPGVNRAVPSREVFDLERFPLEMAASDVATEVRTFAAREVMATWVAEHVPPGAELRERLLELSEHSRAKKSDAGIGGDWVACCHPPGRPHDCAYCPESWKTPGGFGDPCASTMGVAYVCRDPLENNLPDVLMARLPSAISSVLQVPPWNVSLATLTKFGATVKKGTVGLDLIVRQLPAEDVRIGALAELLGRFRAAGVVVVDDAQPSAAETEPASP